MRYPAVLVIALLVCARQAHPEVADSAANGFTVKISVSIQAAPAEVYRRLIGNQTGDGVCRGRVTRRTA